MHLYLLLKKFLKAKKLLITHLNKEKLVPGSGVSMHLEGILMVKKDVLLVNFARRYVQRRQLPLSQLKEKMEAVKLLDMTLI